MRCLLKELRARDAAELRQLKEDRQHLVQVVNQLTLENHQLRHALALPPGRVVALAAPNGHAPVDRGPLGALQPAPGTR